MNVASKPASLSILTGALSKVVEYDVALVRESLRFGSPWPGLGSRSASDYPRAFGAVLMAQLGVLVVLVLRRSGWVGGDEDCDWIGEVDLVLVAAEGEAEAVVFE